MRLRIRARRTIARRGRAAVARARHGERGRGCSRSPGCGCSRGLTWTPSIDRLHAVGYAAEATNRNLRCVAIQGSDERRGMDPSKLARRALLARAVVGVLALAACLTGPVAIASAATGAVTIRTLANR